MSADKEMFNIHVSVTLPANLGLPKVSKIVLQSMSEDGLKWDVLQEIVLETDAAGKTIEFKVEKEMAVRVQGKYAFRVLAMQPMWGEKEWWRQNYVIEETSGTIQIDLTETGKGDTSATLTTALLSNFTQLSSGDGRNNSKFYCDDVVIADPQAKVLVYEKVPTIGECARKCTGECMFLQYTPSTKTCKNYTHTGLNNALVSKYFENTVSKPSTECWVRKVYMTNASARTCNKLSGFQQTVRGCAPGWTWGDFKGCEDACRNTANDKEQRAWTCRYCGCMCGN